MNRAVIPAAGAALLLLLAGCTATETANVTAASDEPAVSAPAASEGPLTAATPSGDADGAPDTPEGAFLVKIRDVLPDDTSIPNASDTQLLAAAQKACEQMAGGADSTMVSVIDGEQKDGAGYYQDSARIGAIAKQTICP
ncbi:DUF732 domain-containing protein [Microbacterium sp. Leaf179]|uniref:DUF732 domain-containing protein n=1 Tax=Microbacterium sp. Leaf179 TaxID=1736288 RepID=UPI000AF07ED4|nr:DUF732 domain-containing protein [Microbacterium sp. Leaf179]